MPSLYRLLSDQATDDLRYLAGIDSTIVQQVTDQVMPENTQLLLQQALFEPSIQVRAIAVLNVCIVWEALVQSDDKKGCDHFVAMLATLLGLSGHSSETTATAAWITTIAALAKSSFALAELTRMRG